jgi:hypothetical protein
MITSLKSVISCEVLNLPTPFNEACFGHVMNKVVQYVCSLVTTNDKVSKDLGMVNINYVQTSFQACMTWPKKISTLRILILTLLTFITLVKTQFASKVVMFE